MWPDGFHHPQGCQDIWRQPEAQPAGHWRHGQTHTHVEPLFFWVRDQISVVFFKIINIKFKNFSWWFFFLFRKPTGILKGHSAPIIYLCIMSEESRIFSVSIDRTVKVMHDSIYFFIFLCFTFYPLNAPNDYTSPVTYLHINCSNKNW